MKKLFQGFSQNRKTGETVIRYLRYKMLIAKIPKSYKRILDLGCGFGDLICALAEKGHQCIGLDISKNYLDRFKDKAEKLGIHLICGDAKKIPLPNSSVDVVICSEILEHITDYEQVLKEAYRVLVPNGIILVSVPYKEDLKKFICPHCGKEIKFYGNTIGHVHSFDENKLFSSMNRYGFEIQYTHRGPTVVSRVIYRKIKIPIILIFLIDNLTNYLLGATREWLIAKGKKYKLNKGRWNLL